MLDADEISNEAIGQLIGPAARFKCEMRFTVPFENDLLESIYIGSILDSDLLTDTGRVAGHDLFLAWAQELVHEAAYISWYGREGTP